MGTLLCVLAMTSIMVSFMHSTKLIHNRHEVTQLARQYVLRMETVGYLTEKDSQSLRKDLKNLGISDISFAGSTMMPMGYGTMIHLQISGTMEGGYGFVEKRCTTAKY